MYLTADLSSTSLHTFPLRRTVEIQHANKSLPRDSHILARRFIMATTIPPLKFTRSPDSFSTACEQQSNDDWEDSSSTTSIASAIPISALPVKKIENADSGWSDLAQIVELKRRDTISSQPVGIQRNDTIKSTQTKLVKRRPSVKPPKASPLAREKDWTSYRVSHLGPLMSLSPPLTRPPVRHPRPLQHELRSRRLQLRTTHPRSQRPPHPVRLPRRSTLQAPAHRSQPPPLRRHNRQRRKPRLHRHLEALPTRGVQRLETGFPPWSPGRAALAAAGAGCEAADSAR